MTEWTPTAEALAVRVAKLVAKARGTHGEKFLALCAALQALGVADSMYDTGPRTNAPGQAVCELLVESN